jgi:hypothetical protein
MSMRPRRSVSVPVDSCFSNSGVIEFKTGVVLDPVFSTTTTATSGNMVAVPETASQIRQCVTDTMLKANAPMPAPPEGVAKHMSASEIQDIVRDSVKDQMQSVSSMRDTVRKHVTNHMESVADMDKTIRTSVGREVDALQYKTAMGVYNTEKDESLLRSHVAKAVRSAMSANRPAPAVSNTNKGSSTLARSHVDNAIRTAINKYMTAPVLASQTIGSSAPSRAEVENAVRSALNTHAPGLNAASRSIGSSAPSRAEVENAVRSALNKHTPGLDAASRSTRSSAPSRADVENAVRIAVQTHMTAPVSSSVLSTQRGQQMREMLY